MDALVQDLVQEPKELELLKNKTCQDCYKPIIYLKLKSTFLWFRGKLGQGNHIIIIAELRRSKGPPSRAPYSSWERKGNTGMDFLMFIMASGIARGRIHTTTAATESRNMAAKHQIYETFSLGLRCTSLILDIHVMLNWHLSIQGIRWPVLRVHIAGSSWELIEVTCFLEVDRWPSAGFFYWIAGSCRVNLVKTGPGCP